MTPESLDLLRSGTRAKWITSVDQHADHLAQTLFTRDRDVIRAWADERGAGPAKGAGADHALDGGTGLRLGFPGMTQVEPIEWDEWFRDFEARGLVFAYRERSQNGQISQQYRTVTPDQLGVEGHQPPPRNDPP